MSAEYQLGDIVFAREAIHNDGGIPGVAEDALLASPGGRGVVVNSGHVEAMPEQAVYLVRFEAADGILGPPVGCLPEELTQVRMGKIIKDKYPELDPEDQEAVRQHAIAALNLTQQAKQLAIGGDDGEPTANTALIDGVRKFAMDVRELDIDLIDRINPFGEAYAILAKAMSEESLKQVAAAISAKRTTLTPDDAKDLAVRAVQFKRERGRVPALDAQDAWERRMAEGAATFMRYKKEGRYE